MADFTGSPGDQKTLFQNQSVTANGGTHSKSMRFANAPPAFTLYVDSGADVSFKAYAVTPLGDREVGSIAAAAGLRHLTITDVVGEVKVTATNAHAADAQNASAVLVAAK